ncbi:YozQ family protein [Bacillus siamensis]|uniref:YozQ family protein n=1 Tax=Bacillus siamensis TaxID=659243 RepID=UPI0029042558|nr:YozQ family protein [Bacillus siamensis]MDU0812713.1 YozQ family protein [Bacillus siamensis]MED5047106.1 YozQ family protein [Bacillus siamensis]MED5096997.1 YozQ family protein [Bacillus siamensis]
MAEQHGTDRPDDYKRFSSLDKDYDFQQQSLAGDTKTNQTDTETQTHHKETDTTNTAGKYFDTSDYEGNTQLERGLAETHEQVSDDYFEGTIDQNLE